MSIFKGWLRASIWCANLCYRGEVGLEGACRVPLRCVFYPLIRTFFLTLRPNLCTEMMAFRISMDMSCEGFVKGFRLRYSPL